MNKFDVLIQGCKAGSYKKLHWLVSLITTTNEDASKWDKDPYPFRIVKKLDGYYCVIKGDTVNNLEKIDDASVDKPIFDIYTPMRVKPDDYVNLKTEVDVTVGNYLSNWIYIAHCVGAKIEYIPTQFTPGQVANKFLVDFRDDVEEGEQEDPKAFYPREYELLADAAAMANGLAEIIVQTPTRNALKTHPDMYKVRDAFWAKNQHRKDDPSAVAEISAIMQKLDNEHLAQDQSADFYKSNKLATARGKLFQSVGAEPGLSGDMTKMTNIATSLNEGWQIETLVNQFDTARYGSYYRGAMTMYGGVIVKEIQRAAGNLQAFESDCGDNRGIERYITSPIIPHIVLRTIIDGNKSVFIEDEQMAGQYVGKSIRVRSPQRCKAQGGGICYTCLGRLLSSSKNGLSAAAQREGSKMMGAFMKANHGKVTKAVRINLDEIIT